MTKPMASHHAAATYWVTRLYSGEMTAQEELELQRWRVHPQHEAALQEAFAVWDLSAELYGTDAQLEFNDAVQHQAKSHGWSALALAASVAVLSILLMLTEHYWKQDDAQLTQLLAGAEQSLQTQVNDSLQLPELEDSFRMTSQAAMIAYEEPRYFSTTVGEVSHIQLDDGSLVSLNTGSAIKVTMSAHQRHVELVHGEAYFDVAKDAQRPFVVATEEQQITVLGTAFNVRHRNDEDSLKVSVVEGRVAVKRRAPSGPATPEPEATKEDDERLLLAGDIGSFSDRSNVIQQQQYAEAEVNNAWRRGIVRFDDDTLANVIRELNRYRVRKITLTDPVKDLRISGVFHLKNGDAILAALTATLPVSVSEDKDHIHIAAR